MQRDVVKYRPDPVLLQSRDNRLPVSLRWQQDVVNVPVVPTIGGHDRATEQAPALERGEHFVVALPVRDTSGGNSLGFLELSPQESRRDLARQKRRAEVLPSVFINLAAVKPAAIGSLLANDFGASDEFGIAYQKAAAFA